MQETEEGGFDPWVMKMPWRMAWQPSPVFLENPVDRGADTLQSMGESDTTGTSQHALRQSTGNNRRFLTALEARNLRSRGSQDFFFFSCRGFSPWLAVGLLHVHMVFPLCVSLS